MNEMNEEQLTEIINEAQLAAATAAATYYEDELNGVDGYPCGFAWINIRKHAGLKIKGNNKMGRLLKKVGIKQDYTRSFQIWNPSNHNCQNIYTKEAGAMAAAKVFESYGFDVQAGTRWD